ncbi:MAG: AmmeMemoRadiSam system protein B [Deltaproteobacteria bacterium]|nr:AmmeMemoRadiSam system protein B [Deltaproteobacteria bacterium]
MSKRTRMLPYGWYPGSERNCREEIEKFVAGVNPLPEGTRVFGGIVPHAGWFFSGKLAARVFYLASRLSQPQVVAVFGGHLGGNSPPLLVMDDAWETPLGDIPLAKEFYDPLKQRLTLKEEYPGDNTIEVQLPMVKYFFPKAKVLALRGPHSAKAVELGEAVAAVAQELKVSLLAFGSTDLTHYGPNYGWAPKGFGAAAVKWVKEVNDRRFIDATLKLDAGEMLRAGAEDQSACSAGGAAAAVAAARKLGAAKAIRVDYYTSYDVMPGDSFVGYLGAVLTG